MSKITEINLMCDLETLGKKPGCGILSIALVPFQVGGLPAPLENFYVRIKPYSNAILGLHTDTSTMEWWNTKSEEARVEAFGGEVPISAALSQLAEYLAGFPAGTLIWGLGASFDIPILEAAYDAYGHSYPWNYTQSMCFRTLKVLYPQVPAPAANTLKHSALADATYQAAHAQRILEWVQKA
jgi:hypothetical protein